MPRRSPRAWSASARPRPPRSSPIASNTGRSRPSTICCSCRASANRPWPRIAIASPPRPCPRSLLAARRGRGSAAPAFSFAPARHATVCCAVQHHPRFQPHPHRDPAPGCIPPVNTKGRPGGASDSCRTARTSVTNRPPWNRRYRHTGKTPGSSKSSRIRRARSSTACACSRTPAAACTWGMCATTPSVTSSPVTSACRARTCCSRWAGMPSVCRRKMPPSRTTCRRPNGRVRTSPTCASNSSVSASPMTGRANSRPATPATTAGNSGSSGGCTRKGWFTARPPW